MRFYGITKKVKTVWRRSLFRSKFIAPTDELDFIRSCGNHNDFSRKTAALGFSNPNFTANTNFVCRAWFDLGIDHLFESKKLLLAGCDRATYSRAYYAAYNVSKSVRYRIAGSVSLKGDDHGKASTELPNDFPRVAHWSLIISTLYEHRLHADYDNWQITPSDFTISTKVAVQLAEDFIAEARTYLNNKIGIVL